MSSNKTLIRGCLLWEPKHGTKATVAAQKIFTAFGDNAVIKYWFKQFSSRDLSFTDKVRTPWEIKNHHQQIFNRLWRKILVQGT